MKKILVLLVALLMVGCEAKDTEKPKQIIEKAVKQEQQVEQPKEEVKEQPKEEVKEGPKQVEKELPKKEEAKKKERDHNIDSETGLAKVKDGTHLEEEAKKQEEEGIIEPEEEPEEDYNGEDYNGEDYSDEWIREYGNTDEIDDYSEENEYN